MARWTVLVAIPIMAGLLQTPYGKAQSTATRPAFEVASIKFDPSCREGNSSESPGRVYLSCASLRGLIATAYGTFDGSNPKPIPLKVLGGPVWLDRDRFVISAKAEGAASVPQMLGPMLQVLLEERFNLKVHKESRDTPVYELTVVRDNPKLQRSKEGSCTPLNLDQFPRDSGPGEFKPKLCGSNSFRVDGTNWVADWSGMNMATFASRAVARYVDRPVLDKTGLTGLFDIHLVFLRQNAADSADATGPSIFTALQQELGLKLVPAKGPVEVLVIDRVEKPSGN